MESASGIRHVTIHVRGRVQGVFFRASTRDIANQLGVRGFVRNEPDGSVYIEAEADEETINRFIAWCRKGPPRAMVEQVDTETGPVQNFSSFTIDRY